MSRADRIVQRRTDGARKRKRFRQVRDSVTGAVHSQEYAKQPVPGGAWWQRRGAELAELQRTKVAGRRARKGA